MTLKKLMKKNKYVISVDKKVESVSKLQWIQ